MAADDPINESRRALSTVVENTHTNIVAAIKLLARKAELAPTSAEADAHRVLVATFHELDGWIKNAQKRMAIKAAEVVRETQTISDGLATDAHG